MRERLGIRLAAVLTNTLSDIKSIDQDEKIFGN